MAVLIESPSLFASALGQMHGKDTERSPVLAEMSDYDDFGEDEFEDFDDEDFDDDFDDDFEEEPEDDFDAEDSPDDDDDDFDDRKA